MDLVVDTSNPSYRNPCEDFCATAFGLTKGQQEALTESYEHGYYEVPRDLDSSALAERLDISHQALSERLRRATGSLIENTLLVDEPDE